jgi:hypothetical protein
LALFEAHALNTAGNAVITIPLLSGGLTNSGNTTTSGAVIVRRVTIQNPSGSVAIGKHFYRNNQQRSKLDYG